MINLGNAGQVKKKGANKRELNKERERRSEEKGDQVKDHINHLIYRPSEILLVLIVDLD